MKLLTSMHSKFSCGFGAFFIFAIAGPGMGQGHVVDKGAEPAGWEKYG
ncbi:hypothetical protein [Noviherbaspirillum cavernae]|nr:hypothetical protein [Noviherbaspirillum cavernae]